MNQGVTPNEKSLNGAWLDFYALLGVERNCASDALRRRIGECYAEASNNCDHRDLQRRLFYQAMVERVLPQCRRVLLNANTRERYDTQYDLHASGSPDALPYVAFMASLMGASAPAAAPQDAPNFQPETAPDATLEAEDSASRLETLNSESETVPATGAASAPTAQAAWEELDYSALPERVRDEIALAREVVETLEHGFAFDLLPSRSVTTGNASPQDEALEQSAKPIPVPSASAVTVRPPSPAPKTETPRPAPYSAPPKPQSHVTTSQPEPENVLEAPEAKRPFKRGAWDSDEKIPRQRPEVEQIVGVVGQNGLMQDDLVFDAAKSRAQRRAARTLPDGYKPRVVLDDRAPAHIGRDDARRGKMGKSAEGIVSSTARLLLTGIVAALMMLVIQRNNTAPVSADVNSALQPSPSAQAKRVAAQAKTRVAAQAKARLAAQRLAAQKKARLVQLQKARQQAAIRQISDLTSTSSVPEATSSVPGTP